MGVIFNAAGALIQGRQEANKLRDQADLEQRAKDIDQNNLENTNRQYSAREEMLRRSARQALGRQRAAIAESGTEFSGTNLDLIGQSTASAELDALNLRYAGAIERAGIQNQIDLRTYNIAALRKGAKTAMKMRWFNAASALFGGAQMGGSGANTAQVQTLPTTNTGAYGQGSLQGFGNNMDNFTSGYKSTGSFLSIGGGG